MKKDIRSLLLLLASGCHGPGAEEGGSAASSGREPKCLLVFVDGFISDALEAAPTPNLHRLIEHGAWSARARAESASISGAGWSTFLTGVHFDKHGVPDNKFEHPDYARYRPVTELLREARPGAEVAISICWKPIWEKMLAPLAYEHASNHEEEAATRDYWDQDSNDADVARDTVRWLALPKLELAIAMFGELDEIGHSDGNLHYDAYDPLYRAMLAKIDDHIGALLAAIRARPTLAHEDWMVIVSADHAGELGRGHGENHPAQVTIPLIVSEPFGDKGGSSSLVRGLIWPPPSPVDIATTALHHLGVTPRQEWGLDGIVLGTRASAPPRAALDTNLIFNGGAELERGYAGTTGQPDASIPGWDDPGSLTVVAYGTPQFPSEGDALPANHGQNFFAGGAQGDSTISQTIELAPLARAIRNGATYELSGWLGGFAEQDDRCLVSATFLADDGHVLARAVLAPVWAADREKRTGFVLRSAKGRVPEDTARVIVRLDALASSGANDGYADELALVIRKR